jgi:hypothetical protein
VLCACLCSEKFHQVTYVVLVMGAVTGLAFYVGTPEWAAASRARERQVRWGGTGGRPWALMMVISGAMCGGVL